MSEMTEMMPMRKIFRQERHGTHQHLFSRFITLISNGPFSTNENCLCHLPALPYHTTSLHSHNNKQNNKQHQHGCSKTTSRCAGTRSQYRRRSSSSRSSLLVVPYRCDCDGGVLSRGLDFGFGIAAAFLGQQ